MLKYNEKLVNDLKQCKTKKQILKYLTDNNIKIYKNNSEEMGCFNIWLDESLRIYIYKKEVIVQCWNKFNFKEVKRLMPNNGTVQLINTIEYTSQIF